ncbi:MAG: hypothetical protein ACON4M_07710 [Crocinitomicaceae bacterium]
MKNLYYRPTPKFNSYNRNNKPAPKKNFNSYLVFGLAFLLLFSFFSGGDDSSNEVVSTSNLVLSKIDGNIRVIDSKSNPIENVQVPFELKDGFSVLTSSDSSAVVSLNSELTFRVAPSSKFVLNDSSDVLDFSLDSGQVWVSNKFSPLDSPSISISTNYLTVDSNLASFNLKSSLPESVSVLSGNLLVSINDDTNGSVLDQIKLDLGKQLTMDNDSYQLFKNRQVASVISTLQSSLIRSSWYKWNVSQDSQNIYQPFSKFDLDYIASLEPEPIVDEESLDIETLEDVVIELDPAVQPVVTTPDVEETQTGDRVIIEGTVPPNTSQVMVVSYDESEPVPYILKEFKPESGKFKYYASYDPGRGNLLVGLNKFDIVAIFADGSESPKTTIEFDYKDKLVSETNSTVVSVPVEETVDPVTSPASPSSNEVLVRDDISIKTINGLTFNNNFVLSSNRGFLQGVVDSDVVSVYVNDFKLTRFTPNSGSFHYIMSPSFNTLKPGDNKVKIYGKYQDGSKTTVLNLNIVYQP